MRKRLTEKYQEPTEIMGARHFRVKVPADYELEYSTKNLAVYWKKGLRSDQGIIMYTEPLPEEDGVIGDRIIPLRDSLTQLYIPGEKEGSYMKVEDLLPPKFENRQLDGHFCIETRGLWRTVNDFMGGAFINYTIFDEVNNQRIMLDGFVYAPELNKRNMLLEMEAILQTFESTN
ncbi:MAG: DUF4837 family protein [Owenweeksia sp.]|nr:DUF4837 family protein [Owenweeksia sp.]